MNRLLIALALMALPLSCAAQTKYTKTERELFRIQREWLDAYTKRDSRVLARLEGDDFRRVDEDGTILTKEQDIERAKNLNAAKPDSLDITESSIRVFGNGAVISGTRWMKRNQENVRQCAYTDTFVNRDGRWVIIATQLTLVRNRSD